MDIFHAQEVYLVISLCLLSFLLSFFVFALVLVSYLVLFGFPGPTKATIVSLGTF